MTSDMTNESRSVSHTGHNTDGPLSVLRRASGKDSLFLLTWMSPQRRRRFRKLSSRIRKSFRAAKRWKSSFRVRRRTSTFRVRSILPNILLCDGGSAELLFSVLRVACEAVKTCLFEVLLLVEAFLKRTILLLVVNSRTAVHMKNVALGRGIQLREHNMQTWILKTVNPLTSCLVVFYGKKFSSALLWYECDLYVQRYRRFRSRKCLEL